MIVCLYGTPLEVYVYGHFEVRETNGNPLSYKK